MILIWHWNLIVWRSTIIQTPKTLSSVFIRDFGHFCIFNSHSMNISMINHRDWRLDGKVSIVTFKKKRFMFPKYYWNHISPKTPFPKGTLSCTFARSPGYKWNRSEEATMNVYNNVCNAISDWHGECPWRVHLPTEIQYFSFDLAQLFVLTLHLVGSPFR